MPIKKSKMPADNANSNKNRAINLCNLGYPEDAVAIAMKSPELSNLVSDLCIKASYKLENEGEYLIRNGNITVAAGKFYEAAKYSHLCGSKIPSNYEYLSKKAADLFVQAAEMANKLPMKTIFCLAATDNYIAGNCSTEAIVSFSKALRFHEESKHAPSMDDMDSKLVNITESRIKDHKLSKALAMEALRKDRYGYQ